MFNQKGFTLIELLIVIAIVAIITTWAIPNFSETMARNRMVANTNQLLSAVQYARSEALRRGGRVILAPVDSKDWAGGTMVFFDRDSDGVLDVNADPALNEELRYWDRLGGRSTMTALASSTAISFDSGGFATANGKGSAPSDSSEALRLCDHRDGETGREVIILISGASYARETDQCK